MSQEPERFSSLYSEQDMNLDGPDPEALEQEGEESVPRGGPREEIPEYDEAYSRTYHKDLATQAVDNDFNERYQSLQQRLQRLPAALPDEDTLLRMPERQKAMLYEAIQERRQLTNELRRFPQEYERARQEMHQKADAIVDQHLALQSKFPARWHKIIDMARELVDMRKLKATELSNPNTYEVLDMMVLGREQREKASKSKLRKAAQAGQFAGRGGAADSNVDHEENLSMGGKTPRQTFRQYLNMGLGEQSALRATRRLFPGWEP